MQQGVCCLLYLLITLITDKVFRVVMKMEAGSGAVVCVTGNQATGTHILHIFIARFCLHLAACLQK